MSVKQILVLQIFIFGLLTRTCITQRRIVDGFDVDVEVRYMAYLVKSEQSERFYHGWTCGGVIITPLHILTAAACVIDVDHLYAIVGYDKYVGADAIDDDPCTKRRKKRVVRTCTPKAYNVLLSGWTNHDIGIAELESPLNFTDVTYKIDCSYPPTLIRVNFDAEYEKPDIDVVTMGWGHSKKMRLPHHLQDHNVHKLQQASIKTVDRDVCVKKFDHDPHVERVIENDIICCEGEGDLKINGMQFNINEDRIKCDIEEEVSTNETTTAPNITTPNATTLTDIPTTSSETTKTTSKVLSTATTKTTTSETLSTATLSKTTPTTKTTTSEKLSTATTTTKTTTTTTTTTKKPGVLRSETLLFDYYDDNAYDELFKRLGGRRNICRRRNIIARRAGICQNDHGGPLIAWIGVHPIVIGVASINLYNNEYNCVTPNIFTSTMKNEWFIKCSIMKDPKILRTCSDMGMKKGVRMDETISNWLPKGNKQRMPLYNPTAQLLQNLLGSYLRENSNAYNSNPYSEQMLNNRAQLNDNQEILNPQRGLYKQLSNHEKHLVNQQKYDLNENENEPNSQQGYNIMHGVANYAKLLQSSDDNEPKLQQFVPNLQNIPIRQDTVLKPQQTVPDYPQNVSNYELTEPSPEQDDNPPENAQNYEQSFKEAQYEANHPKMVLMRLRPQKSLYKAVKTLRPRTQTASRPRLTTTLTVPRPRRQDTTIRRRLTIGKLKRRKTLPWASNR